MSAGGEAGAQSEAEATHERGAVLPTLWWVGLPLVCRRLSASLFAYLLDGVWIFAFRPLAAVATPVAAVAGVVVGATTAGYSVAPFESVLLVSLVVVVGTFSAHLGLALVTGLAVGDFFLVGRDWTIEPTSSFGLPTGSPGLLDEGLVGALARERLPLVIGYALLAVVAVGIPALVKGLLAQLPVPSRWPTGVQVGLSVAGHAGLTYFFVDFWVIATPVLIRPMWVWPLDQVSTRSVSLALVQPLQGNGSVVVALAVAASLARMAVQWHVALDRRRAARMSALQERLRRWAGVPSPPGRIRRLGRVVWRTAAGTLLLAGMLATWADAVVLATVLFVAGLVQLGVVPVPMGEWPVTAARIPLLVRMAGALVFVRLLVQPLAERLVDPGAATFRTFLVMCVLAMLVFMALLPAPPALPREAER
ncbi:MAG: hypothetical protein KY439_11155 [Actinobacteria bacterium]|nr:hypothetical protein [Actinomycetota bacterium]